jgi:AcrR family transcriptional regulator
VTVVAGSSTREALLEQGALLFARHGVAGVTARQLHEAIGTRNESALHYHFGGKDGLVTEILRSHLEAIEARRSRLVVILAAEERTGDLRALVHALAAPMAEDLETRLGRAHLRLVARANHPSLAYDRPFPLVDAPSGIAVVRWLWAALGRLPDPVLRERLAALRGQLVGLFGERAQLIDDRPGRYEEASELFVENLVDVLVAGLQAEPSAEALAASARTASPAPESDLDVRSSELMLDIN